MRYRENTVPRARVLYGATYAPFIYRKLQDKREKSRILQVKNLEKVANMELVGSKLNMKSANS